uniref:Uncharacterized protein LOC107421764 n=1 Tax=Rhizophora mucronata TaxID=61149 RepID=A0A2P2JJ89_RHIMU
MNMVYSTS